jgi:hypothetical protein
MLDVGETAEAFAFGLIPGYTIGDWTYRYATEGDPITNEEIIGGGLSFLLQTYLVNKMGLVGFGSRAGLFFMTAGETMAELRYLFPRTMGIGGFIGGVASGATVGYLAGEYVGKPAMKKMEQKYGTYATETGLKLGWSLGMTAV